MTLFDDDPQRLEFMIRSGKPHVSIAGGYWVELSPQAVEAVALVHTEALEKVSAREADESRKRAALERGMKVVARCKKLAKRAGASADDRRAIADVWTRRLVAEWNRILDPNDLNEDEFVERLTTLAVEEAREAREEDAAPQSR